MKHLPILIADDDEDDRFLIKAAFEECGSSISLFFVQDGLELMQYLNNENAYADANVYKQPSLILLDLNMPKKDGREIIQEMRANSNFRAIPIVVLSTSNAPSDIRTCYELGANSFITKPSSFEGLLEIIKNLQQFWFVTASLPQ
ncbi:response regulator [Flectobacillus sp. DC10W]|jgi:CheY-like chemotaxis protein|uniref:Response regulator n=1 Tax=Flectobacillus longus TaxID=2984207 RepID=A0ABT6YLV1_9BACT|nr:response regulator [Flectobacillus longus]MDI9864555.1 response regulator [Flectobacillus longus]